MKPRSLPLLPLFLAALFPATGPAAEPARGLYYTVDGGVNLAQSVDLSAGGLSDSVGFDAGYRFGVALGYQLDRQWGVQLDTGYLYNSTEGSGKGSLSHVPFILSGRWQQPLPWHLTGTLGLGVGGALNKVELGTGSTSDTDQKLSVAWQVSAGISYPLADNMSVGLTYQYWGTPETDYELKGQDVQLGVSHNHSIALGFRLDF